MIRQEMKLHPMLFGIVMVLIPMLLIPGCAKLDKIMVRQGGEWNIDQLQHKETLDGVVDVDTLVYEFGKVTFKDDSTCEVIFGNESFGIDTTQYTWTTDEATLTMVPTSTVEPPAVWTVEKSQANAQQWSRIANDSINNQFRVTEDHLKLRRIK